MAPDENAFGELIDDYIDECLPLAEQVGDAFVELERRWRAGDGGDDLLAQLKGRLHTVKGNSAMMGLAPMQLVAHALEDLCAVLDSERALRGDEVGNLLVRGSGLLIDLIRTAAKAPKPKPAEQFVKQVRIFLDRRPGKRARSKKPGLLLERRRNERTPEEGMEADSSSSVVRVDFRRLDVMLEVLGESLIEQAAVAEVYRVLVRKLGPTNELVDLDRGLVALQKTMKRLEGILMETRLLPISSVFGRFPRLVRELAQAKQKQVRVVTTGGEIPLDKAVLDRIGEPLMHLLTNAVAHGIESPEVRARAGKPAEGTLSLRASSESGRVVLRLSDDGGGLDDSRIRAKAQSLGLEMQSADTEQLHSLIFLPGFSTADQVSSLAGRGVGLDVVANAVHELGGTIEVESRPGQGVTFTLSLPLTLAILRSLIVEVDRERYAVPISHVAATVRTEPDTIHQVNQKGVTLWRGNLIHVCDGGALLGTGAGANTTRRFYVVISMGSRTRAILVDRLIGHQDIVVKSLDPTLGRPEVISGTTILGDGRVACILDAGRILDQRMSA
ncbi:MAG: two-component system, chemotaxis family, sensor kinase CheA [Gemmatimonadales bacterium]|jgi:two-component system chemotaxis sensor kinase CheA|nr:two-component system, chemotaxis family, sensor kinase CheA [Gemmatimonadales bacterium]